MGVRSGTTWLRKIIPSTPTAINCFESDAAAYKDLRVIVPRLIQFTASVLVNTVPWVPSAK